MIGPDSTDLVQRRRVSAVVLALLGLAASAWLGCSGPGAASDEPGAVEAPIADAGADQTVPRRSAVQLDGSGSSDPGGLPLSFRWIQISGPLVTLVGSSTIRPTFEAPELSSAVTLEFELEVSNGSSTATARTRVMVVDHIDLAVEAGADQRVSEGQSVVLLAEVTAPASGLGALRYAWLQLSGPSVELTNPDRISTSFVAPAVAGTAIELRFQVTVSHGTQTEVDVVSVIVEATPASPGDDDGPLPDDGDPSEGSPQDPPDAPTTCQSNSDCDDGLFCNGGEQCTGGSCQAGTPACAGQPCDEGQDACLLCVTQADCDDGVYCNGIEACLDGGCFAGAPPCAGQGCDESVDVCGSCAGHADCDDGKYCNGAEACVGGICQAGAAPCADLCDESDDVCVACFSPDDCDDTLFCNGTEACISGTCVSSQAPCPQQCDESADECVECLSAADCTDDGLFCNGPEDCFDGTCSSSGDPCTAGHSCDEAAETCTSG